jgi:hypothetical protein
MRARLKHAKRHDNAIREILFREWDPLGVSDDPDAQGEYDGYVWVIYGMLARRQPRDHLVDHLWYIETSHLGLFGDRQRAEAIVDRHIELHDQIEADA